MCWKKKQKQQRQQTALLKHKRNPSKTQRPPQPVGSHIMKGLSVKCKPTNCFILSLSDLKSELKALIEKEVREQMALVCGQLEQRMKGIAESPPHKANRTGAKKQ